MFNFSICGLIISFEQCFVVLLQLIRCWYVFFTDVNLWWWCPIELFVFLKLDRTRYIESSIV